MCSFLVLYCPLYGKKLQLIRSSNHPLMFANSGKRSEVCEIVDEYRLLVQNIIDDAWTNGFPFWNVSFSRNKLDFRGYSLLPTQHLKTFKTWLSARMQQAAGKQAVMMLKAAASKRRKQLYKLAELQRLGKFTKWLQSKIDREPLIKPDASDINLELDSRFVDFQEQGGFLFIKIKSIGGQKGRKVILPIKETQPSKKWSKKGQRKDAIRLTKDRLWLIHEIPNKPFCGDQIVGADQGIVTVLTLSNGLTTRVCPHGHTLSTIQAGMSRKERGSRAFGRAQEHRKNYTNWSLNQLRSGFQGIKEVRLEKIRNLRKDKRTPRFLTHWVYPLVKQKIVRLGEEEGFLFKEVSNEFRSQRCAKCGWVRRANRKGKTFKCGHCDHVDGADLNAASNLRLDLYEIPYWVRLKRINRKGFFWTPDGLFTESWERIVPSTTKA